jgi:hypothetical protein
MAEVDATFCNVSGGGTLHHEVGRKGNYSQADVRHYASPHHIWPESTLLIVSAVSDVGWSIVKTTIFKPFEKVLIRPGILGQNYLPTLYTKMFVLFSVTSVTTNNCGSTPMGVLARLISRRSPSLKSFDHGSPVDVPVV